MLPLGKRFRSSSNDATNPLTTAIILDRAALTTICVPYHSHRNGKGARTESKEHRERDGEGRAKSKVEPR